MSISQISVKQNISAGVRVLDGFCGAGGSSAGLQAAGGEIAVAINHNKRSLATHAANFPRALHRVANIATERPAEYPRTEVAWFSPECTMHSTSRGIPLAAQGQLSLWTDRDDDPFVKRSRATMWEVVRWTQSHRYEVVFVENVPEVTLWHGYHAWLTSMDNLGYQYKTLCFNSMFAPPVPAPVPQSRDRWYAVVRRFGACLIAP